LVLAIVGLVIGGIWTAAEAVQRSNRRQDMQRLLLNIQEKLLTLYPMSTPFVADCVYACLTKTLAGENAVLRSSAPAALQNFFITPANENIYFDRSSGLYMEIVGRVAYAAGLDMINWALGPLDYKDCVWLAGSSATDYTPRFYSLVRNRYTGYEASFRIDASAGYVALNPSSAPTICTANDNWLVFRMMRP